LIGNAEGKLHVQRQVEDYMCRGAEFEEIGFLTFIVETYERRLTSEEKTCLNESDENMMPSNENCRYIHNHPKKASHIRVRRSENHNVLPNIVGPWFPRRNGDENTRCYYFAAMLALLKPWRKIQGLKDESELWEEAFDKFMASTTQRDKDVVAGCQYYYESRSVGSQRVLESERELDVEERVIEDEDELETHIEQDDSIPSSVSGQRSVLRRKLINGNRQWLVMKTSLDMKLCNVKIKNTCTDS
jgi:hypothetical protein